MTAATKAFWAIMVILVSGLLLWLQTVLDAPPTPWYKITHVLLNAILLTFVVFPFFMLHRRLLQTSKRLMSKWSGLAIESVFYTQIVLGSYLLLVGDQDGLEASAKWLHLNLSLLLVTAIITHTILAKWLLARQRKA